MPGRMDPFSNGRTTWIIAIVLFLLPISLVSLTRLEFNNDVENWLGDESEATSKYHWFKEQFHPESGFIVTWDSSHWDDVRIKEFAERLEGTEVAPGKIRGGLRQIKSVMTPHELFDRMVSNKVPPELAFERVQGLLAGRGAIRVELSEEGREGMEETIARIREWARIEFGQELVISEPFQDGHSQEEAGIESLSRPYDLIVGWNHDSAFRDRLMKWLRTMRSPTIGGEEQGELLVVDCWRAGGAPLGLAIVLNEAGQADRAGTFEEIRRIADESGIPAKELHMGGSPVAASALNHGVLHSIWDPAAPWYLRSRVLLSGVLGMGISILLLRSFRLSMIVLFTVAVTVIFSISLVNMTGGAMDMVLVVLPPLLMGITLSGAVHFANYWRECARDEPRSSAVTRAWRLAIIPCALATVTTAIGEASLCTSPLRPVQNFGIYGAIGTTISLLTVLFFMPALIKVWLGATQPILEKDRRRWIEFGGLIGRNSGAIIVTWILVTGIFTYFASTIGSESKVIRYFRSDSKIVADYQAIEENVTGITPVETIVRFSQESIKHGNFLDRMETIRRIEDRIRLLPDVTGAISLADFQPDSTKPAEMTTAEKLRRNTRAQVVLKRLREEEKSRSLFIESTSSSPFHKAGDELWRITAQVEVLRDSRFENLASQIDQICQSETRYYPDADHSVTGVVPLFLATQRELFASLKESCFYAFVTIALLFSVQMKNIFAGIIAMIPNLAPILITFGSLGLLGHKLDVGIMITGSVGLGIAVDSTMHQISWFLKGLQEGKGRRDATNYALAHCGPAMWQTSSIVIACMVLLTGAELQLISRFGSLVISIIFLAWLADVILTPALLSGFLGWILERPYRIAAREKNNEINCVPIPHLESINKSQSQLGTQYSRDHSP